jgi:hypothetical protein
MQPGGHNFHRRSPSKIAAIGPLRRLLQRNVMSAFAGADRTHSEIAFGHLHSNARELRTVPIYELMAFSIPLPA